MTSLEEIGGPLEGTGTTDAGRDEVTTIRQRPWLTPLIGSTLLLVILLAGPLYGRLTSGGKIDDDIDRSASTVDVTVDLPFEPESYHRETLSELGVFAGRDRSDPTKMRLRAVTQDDLDRIANLFWVERIEPG
ncbi:MAG: hypothetical protein ACR2PK_10800 [Acidimicrobiales bacterium]